MSRDGRLAELFRDHLPEWQWSRIETGPVCPGVPDLEYCAPGGITGWIECKKTDGWRVYFTELQPSWLSRRARLGGRVTVAVRRKDKFLYMIQGLEILRLIEEKSLKGFQPLAGKEVREWDWEAIESNLRA